MAHHISPKSIASYISGIQSQLEPFFPNVRQVCRSTLVTKTLQGCRRLKRAETKRRRPLEPADVVSVVNSLKNSGDHDDILFMTQLVVGFCALHRLGELVWPDRTSLQSIDIPMRHDVVLADGFASYFLPTHKGDRTFEGNRIVLQHVAGPIDPDAIFRNYLSSRDRLCPLVPFLWARSDGSVPRRSWFLSRLGVFFPPDIGGHSMRSGGALALALAGVPPDRIQDMGRWSSEAFKIYIRKHPVLLQSLLWGRPVLDRVFTH